MAGRLLIFWMSVSHSATSSRKTSLSFFHTFFTPTWLSPDNVRPVQAANMRAEIMTPSLISDATPPGTGPNSSDEPDEVCVLGAPAQINVRPQLPSHSQDHPLSLSHPGVIAALLKAGLFNCVLYGCRADPSAHSAHGMREDRALPTVSKVFAKWERIYFRLDAMVQLRGHGAPHCSCRSEVLRVGSEQGHDCLLHLEALQEALSYDHPDNEQEMQLAAKRERDLLRNRRRRGRQKKARKSHAEDVDPRPEDGNRRDEEDIELSRIRSRPLDAAVYYRYCKFHDRTGSFAGCKVAAGEGDSRRTSQFYTCGFRVLLLKVPTPAGAAAARKWEEDMMEMYDDDRHTRWEQISSPMSSSSSTSSCAPTPRPRSPDDSTVVELKFCSQQRPHSPRVRHPSETPSMGTDAITNDRGILMARSRVNQHRRNFAKLQQHEESCRYGWTYASRRNLMIAVAKRNRNLNLNRAAPGTTSRFSERETRLHQEMLLEERQHGRGMFLYQPTRPATVPFREDRSQGSGCSWGATIFWNESSKTVSTVVPKKDIFSKLRLPASPPLSDSESNSKGSASKGRSSSSGPRPGNANTAIEAASKPGGCAFYRRRLFMLRRPTEEAEYQHAAHDQQQHVGGTKTRQGIKKKAASSEKDHSDFGAEVEVFEELKRCVLDREMPTDMCRRTKLWRGDHHGGTRSGSSSCGENNMAAYLRKERDILDAIESAEIVEVATTAQKAEHARNANTWAGQQSSGPPVLVALPRRPLPENKANADGGARGTLDDRPDPGRTTSYSKDRIAEADRALMQDQSVELLCHLLRRLNFGETVSLPAASTYVARMACRRTEIYAASLDLRPHSYSYSDWFECPVVKMPRTQDVADSEPDVDADLLLDCQLHLRSDVGEDPQRQERTSDTLPAGAKTHFAGVCPESAEVQCYMHHFVPLRKDMAFEAVKRNAISLRTRWSAMNRDNFAQGRKHFLAKTQADAEVAPKAEYVCMYYDCVCAFDSREKVLCHMAGDECPGKEKMRMTAERMMRSEIPGGTNFLMKLKLGAGLPLPSACPV